MKEQQRAYAVNDEFLLLHETAEGFAYTFLNADYTLRDGGVYDSAEDTIDTVLTDILEGAELHDENTMLLPLDYNEVYDAHCQAEEHKLKKAQEGRTEVPLSNTAQENDSLSIYQVKSGAAYRNYRFTGTKELARRGEKVNPKNYDLVYTAPLDTNMQGMPNESKLNKIYAQFNIDHPQDFTGHSLSIGDVVALTQDGKTSFHFVDRFGFNEIPFEKAMEPLQRPNVDIALLTENSNYVRVEEHTGTWYVVDSMEYAGPQYFLLESEQHGDMAANLIVDANGKLVLEDVYNGFDDLLESFPSLETEKEIPTPDQCLTDKRIKTQRGGFRLTTLTQEQMQAQGYGTHHMSDDRKYAIMGNGSRAFAVSMEPVKAMENPLQNAEMSMEQNYNMIDGVINNLPPEKEAERPSLRNKMRTIDAQLKQKEQTKPREKSKQKER